MEASHPLSEGKEAYSIVKWWDSLNSLNKHCHTCAPINRVYHFSLSTYHPMKPGKGLYVCNFTHSLIHVYTMLRLRNHHYHHRHRCCCRRRRRCCCCRRRYFYYYYYIYLFISPSCRRTIKQFLLAQTTIYSLCLHFVVVVCNIPCNTPFVSDPLPPPNHCSVSLDIILSLYTWRHYVTLKWLCQPTNLHSVKTQRTVNI
jgi:hypothetical protein